MSPLMYWKYTNYLPLPNFLLNPNKSNDNCPHNFKIPKLLSTSNNGKKKKKKKKKRFDFIILKMY